MIATFFFMASSMLSTPIIAGFAGSLGANGMMMGIVASTLSFTSLFCRPIAGNLADRTSKRRLAFIGAALYVAADVWYACATNPWSLILARVVNGVGFACCSVCLATWLSMLLPLSRMGAGMGLYGTMNALAQAVGPEVGIRVSASWGDRPAFFIAAGMAVLMVVAVLLIKDPGQPLAKRIKPEAFPESVDDATEEFLDGTTHAPAPSKKHHKFSLDKLFEPKVIPIAIIFMMFAIPYFANQAFLVDYAQDRHLVMQVSLYFPFYAIALLTLRIALRNWFDSKSFLFFMIICTLCDLGMLWCLTIMKNDWVLLAAGILTAGSYGLMSSVTQAKAVVIAGKARSGMANTTYYAGIDLGMSLGPLLGGFLYQKLPIAWFYPVLMITMPIAWIIFVMAHSIINANTGAHHELHEITTHQ